MNGEIMNVDRHEKSLSTPGLGLASQASCVYLPRMVIHTATGEASRVYSISLNTTTDGCFLCGRGASCITFHIVVDVSSE